jgi:hypothetical protein
MHALVLLVLAAPPAQSRLPLKTLVLYENGVGYFERRGAVPNGAVAEIPLEPGQLDDALKSLVVMSAQGVASVEFAPPLSAEAARALAGLPERENQASLSNLCRSLTGVEVEVRREGSAAVVKGRVVEVAEEAQDRVDKEGHPIPEPTLLVFGEGGLAKVPLRLVTAVRPTGSQVSLAWSRAVGARALQPERERLVVRGASGGGQVAVGYTTEAPVWRTTYRLVMGKKQPRLQGFALVHNDSDEPWDQVKVTLASGHPTSFLFPLAGPRYGRRELLAPQDGLDTAPQLATREAREHLRGEGEWVGLSGVGVGGGGYGMGTGALGGVAVGRGAGSVTMGSGISSTVLEDGPTPIEPAAVSEAGDLFLYNVKEPVVLGARKSALLPIVDGNTRAERVTLLDGEGRIFTAVRLENTTVLTLEGGTISVFTDGAYTGETQLDRVKPGEVRVLKHGEDLDLEVARSSRREEGDPRKAKVVGVPGARVLELARVDRLVHTIDFTSRTNVPRVVLVELSEQRYRVVSGGTEDVRSPGQPRFGRLTVAPRASEAVELVEEGAVVERIAADQLSSARLDALLTRKAPDEVKALLGQLRAEVLKAEQARDLVATLDQKLRALESDLTRTRENLAAVGKANAAEAAKKLGAKLLALEDELAAVKKSRDESASLAALIRRQLLAPEARVSAR